MDTSIPDLPESDRFNFTIDRELLHCDKIPDYTNLSTRMSIFAKSASRSLLHERSVRINPVSQNTLKPLKEVDILDTITSLDVRRAQHEPLGRVAFSQAFDDIAYPSKRVHVSTVNEAIDASVFDRTFSLVVLDLAPYVRSIVHYDSILSARRLQLSNLLSQGGRMGKKVRTTRASRSALEGGSRETTRKERYFDGAVNSRFVMATGGEGWQDVLVNQMQMREEIEVESEVHRGAISSEEDGDG
jgi:hypothetical protein